MANLPSLDELRALPASRIFPGARSAQGARAGLLLFHGQWEEAHTTAQDLASAEGSFWHGIIHRLEPDPGNAGYWFRRTGRHAVFPALREAVREIESRYPDQRLDMGGEWDPFAWIDFWEMARRNRGSSAWRMAEEIGQAEWKLLYEYCTGPA